MNRETLSAARPKWLELERRSAAEKLGACVRYVDSIMDAITAEKREPDTWEAMHLAYAIRAIVEERYYGALTSSSTTCSTSTSTRPRWWPRPGDSGRHSRILRLMWTTTSMCFCARGSSRPPRHLQPIARFSDRTLWPPVSEQRVHTSRATRHLQFERRPACDRRLASCRPSESTAHTAPPARQQSRSATRVPIASLPSTRTVASRRSLAAKSCVRSASTTHAPPRETRSSRPAGTAAAAVHRYPGCPPRRRRGRSWGERGGSDGDEGCKEETRARSTANDVTGFLAQRMRTGARPAAESRRLRGTRDTK